jgi:hypothetical protein
MYSDDMYCSFDPVIDSVGENKLAALNEALAKVPLIQGALARTSSAENY